MTLDPNTFGEAPAALYLVELLNQRNDPVLTRKVSKVLATQRETLNELGEAHLRYDTINIKTFGRLLTLMSEHNKTSATKHLEAHDKFIAHLVVNVLEGGIKTWKRRIAEAARKHSNIARNTPSGCSVEYPLASPLLDEKNARVLQERSKRYLQRKGKIDTLY